MASEVLDRLHQIERLHHLERLCADLGVFDLEQNGNGEPSLVLRALAPGVSIHRVVEAVGVPLRIPPELIRPGSTL